MRNYTRNDCNDSLITLKILISAGGSTRDKPTITIHMHDGNVTKTHTRVHARVD